MAAMAGAINGAFLGLEGIPRAWARLVTDWGEWGYGDLISLTGRACDMMEERKGR